MAETAEALRDAAQGDPKADKKAQDEQRKAAKQAENQAAKQAKKQARQEKKESKRGRGGVAVLVVLFVLIIASGVFLYFSLINDWGGVRTSFLTAVNKLDPSFHTVQAGKIEQYNEARAQLEKDQAALAAEKLEFETYRTQQNADISRRRAEVDALAVYVQPIYRQGLSEEKIAELQETSKSFALMEPKTAANLLSRLSDDTHVAIVLYYMDASDRANIMSEMSADLAARVTTILIKD